VAADPALHKLATSSTVMTTPTLTGHLGLMT
jgi:hypothetical protein